MARGDPGGLGLFHGRIRAIGALHPDSARILVGHLALAFDQVVGRGQPHVERLLKL